MINTDMRFYNYYTIGEPNAYGQPQLPAADAAPNGQIKMAINVTSTGTQDNIKYKDASYIGLTLNKSVKDTFIVEYGNERLKVLYVQPKGKYLQVFMRNI